MADLVEDRALVRAVLDGDTDRFAVVVERFQARIFAMARRYANQEQQVEDLAQTIFIKAHQRLASWRGDAPLEHWLMRLAVRTCYDFLRQQHRQRVSSFTDLSEEERIWILSHAAADADCREAEVDAEGARALLDRLLQRLDPDSRMVLTLLELDGHSVQEVANLLGWSSSRVKVRAFRARNQLRRSIQHLPVDKYL